MIDFCREWEMSTSCSASVSMGDMIGILKPWSPCFAQGRKSGKVNAIVARHEEQHHMQIGVLHSCHSI